MIIWCDKMYKSNETHRQTHMFAFSLLLSAAMKEQLEQTPEAAFYQLIFCEIDESLFSVLYSGKTSRPNAPINVMIGALILKESKLWSYEEMFHDIAFDLRIRTALGLHDLVEVPFCSATIFNFQNRIMSHYIKTGEDLLEQVLDNLTAEQIERLGLKTSIQRGDSFLANSNIRSYSRLQLLVEVLLRLYRILSEADRATYHDLFAPYLKQSSGQYVYRLKQTDLTSRLETLAQTYHTLHQALAPTYQDVAIFQIFSRVYTEHFNVVEEKINVIPAKELSSSILQSPDDVDATYRDKDGDQSQGQTIHATETAHPDNPLQLITDIAVDTNNTDDSVILNKRLDPMMEKTPDLDELHTDAAYGSEDNDRKMEKLGITHIQTAIRGLVREVPLTITQTDKNAYQISCPHQTVPSQPTKTRFKACFNQSICQTCPLAKACSTIPQKQGRIHYFSHEDYLRSKRHQAILNIPVDRRKIRPNVEATVREFRRRMPDHKLKVRGKYKTRRFAVLMAIGINFGRIVRFQLGQGDHCAQNQQKMA